MNYYRRIEELTAMENSLLITTTMLTQEVSDTAKQAIAYESIAPEGPSLTFPIPRNGAGSLLINHGVGSRLLFGSVVSYRVMGPDKELRRYVDELPAPTSIAPHPVTQLVPPRDSSYYGPDREFKVLAKGVETFELEAVNIAGLGSATSITTNLREAEILRLTLRLERQMSHRYGVSMVLDLVPKN